MSEAAPAPEPGRAAGPWLAFARDRLDELLRWADGLAPDAIAFAQLPAPAVPIDDALVALGRASGEAPLLWDPPGGPSFAAAGVAARLAVEGGDGARQLRLQAEALWPRIREAPTGGSPDGPRDGGAPAARLFGGLAFQPGAASSPLWRAHGDGAFTLPRVRYARIGERAFLAFALEPRRAAAAASAHRCVEAIAAASDGTQVASGASPAAITGVAQQDRACWSKLIAAALEGIAAGRLRKVVAARSADVEAAAPFDVAQVIRALTTGAAGCVRFALPAGSAAFLGATPERLVARKGDAVRTEALAGTIAAGAGAGQRLLESAKDREEHDLVVREIERRLGPLCRELVVPRVPSVRPLRELLHLCSPIEGTLRAPTHVLALAEALHPTPAVAGLPTEAALAFIAAHEAEPRGWYAGPVGWFDAAGDGELAVALRSGVVEGARARLWTGAGIVTGSDAEREYEETALKQRTMLAALGVASPATSAATTGRGDAAGIQATGGAAP